MKVAIIGGAGVRVPLLVRGLAQAGLGIGEIALFDIDAPRLAAIADLSRRVAGAVTVSAHDRPEPCIEGAGFVITSIRVGGARQRAEDEATALAHGVVAQETVGAVGFAMAVRTIPAMVEYARLAMRFAPGAWLITFTNPVSVVTQAVRQETGARAIGICDTPYEIFEDAAHALGLPATECDYDYFGLNHLGWLREVYHRGVPQMDRLWNDPARLESAYRDSLFETSRLRDLRLLPSEYLYYYYRPETALEHLRRAGTSRGVHVASVDRRAVRRPLARRAGPGRAVRGLSRRAGRELHAARDGQHHAARQAGLGRAVRLRPHRDHDHARDRSRHGRRDSARRHERRQLSHSCVADDVVEVPCAVDADGPRALPVPPVPDHCASLMTLVKEYERATIAAALSGSARDRERALSLNPLSGPRERVATLAAALVTS